MIRYLLLALVVILAVIVVRLPARPIIERLPPGAVQLAQPAGTLWRGSAQLSLDDEPLGLLRWTVDPLALLRLDLAADLSLTGPRLKLTGTARIGADRAFAAQVEGEVGNRLLNVILAPYAIRIDGDLTVRPVTLAGELLTGNPTVEGVEDVIAFTELTGALYWAGGLASYTLQAGTSTTPFPPLKGILGLSGEQLPELAVYSSEVDYALLRAGVLPGGFVKVGVSRYFTALAGMPWPGREPDDAIVLEVEQQVF